jgi:hypothetical protein
MIKQDVPVLTTKAEMVLIQSEGSAMGNAKQIGIFAIVSIRPHRFKNDTPLCIPTAKRATQRTPENNETNPFGGCTTDKREPTPLPHRRILHKTP